MSKVRISQYQIHPESHNSGKDEVRVAHRCIYCGFVQNRTMVQNGHKHLDYSGDSIPVCERCGQIKAVSPVQNYVPGTLDVLFVKGPEVQIHINYNPNWFIGKGEVIDRKRSWELVLRGAQFRNPPMIIDRYASSGGSK